MECNECTLCCKLFPVDSINKPPNTPCQHCNVGCEIYEDRPEACAELNCAYLQSKKARIETRPDKCGIVFQRLSDRIFLGSLDSNMEPTDIAKMQVVSFMNQGFSVVLCSIHKWENGYFICEGHNEEDIRKEFNELKINYGKLWNRSDSSN